MLRQDIVSTPAANLSIDTLSNIIGITKSDIAVDLW
jgi:hypothetical protein